MNITVIINFLGGLAMFLFSMKMMSDNLHAVAGNEMKNILKKLTSTPLRGVLVGLTVTGIIQSSSATSVMLIGLVNAGLLNLSQAIGVVMGTNIGTTVTAQIIAFKLGDMAYILVFIGVLMMFLKQSKAMDRWSMIILFFGLLFVSINTMSDAAKIVIDNDPRAIEVIKSASTNPILAILISVAFTVILQSSSAVSGIIIVLASQGFFKGNIEGAMYLIFGSNIGTTIKAWLACIGGTKTAMRVALVHTLFNVIGTVIFTLLTFYGLYQVFIHFITPGSLEANTTIYYGRFVANTHTAFNIFCCLLFLPFTGLLSKLTYFVIKEDKSETLSTGEPKHLNRLLLKSSELAVEQSIKEMREMLKLVKQSLEMSMEAFLERNYRKQEKIAKIENAIDHLQKEITFYLVDINDNSNIKSITRKIPSLLHTVNDIEKLGDLAEQVNEILNNQILTQKATFYPDFFTIIAENHNKILYMIDLCLEYMIHFRADYSYKIIELEGRINQQHSDLRKRLLQMIQNADCDAASGLNTIDYIDTIENIADKMKNIVKAGTHNFIYLPPDIPKAEREVDS